MASRTDPVKDSTPIPDPQPGTSKGQLKDVRKAVKDHKSAAFRTAKPKKSENVPSIVPGVNADIPTRVRSAKEEQDVIGKLNPDTLARHADRAGEPHSEAELSNAGSSTSKRLEAYRGDVNYHAEGRNPAAGTGGDGPVYAEGETEGKANTVEVETTDGETIDAVATDAVPPVEATRVD